jgi:gentisate 1,2-dioxygenase
MVMSSSGFRHLVSRAPATIQATRAQYLTKPPVADVESSVQAHVFADEAGRAFDSAAKTGLIELDRGEQIGVDYPATTANLLARYLVLREGDEFEFDAQASSVLCYVMKGSGRSFQEDEKIEWTQGDVFLMAGGVTISNEAPNSDAVLFVVTDEPLLAALGCTALPFDEAQVLSAHYTARTIAAQLEDIGARAGESATQANLGFASSQFEQRGCVAPAIGAGIATLEPGADQSPHCHDVDTISLGLECESAHALVEDVQIDWIANAAMLTPAGAVHSQHNRGEQRLFSFYVQDLGPRNVRTWEPRVSHEPELEGIEIPV